jgi:hypothetical protein
MEQNKEAISLLKVLSQGSTQKSRDLIKSYGKGDAMNYADLEVKLADLYRTAPDKVEIEKQFAAIHPHSEFIMKYMLPQAISNLEGEKNEDATVLVDENKSNCNGTSCPCKSSAEGKEEVKADKKDIPINTIHHTMIGAIAIVAIFGLFLHYSNKNK